MIRKLSVKEIFGIILVIILFILASYFSQRYNSELINLISGRNIEGTILYIVIVIFSFIFAPVNSLPLLPVAVSLWGVLNATLLSIFAWTIGGFLTYYLSRRYGRKLVLKFVREEEIEKYKDIVPEKNIFLTLVFLHVVLPGDILGYVLGIFLNVSLKTYLLATFIGVIPFALIFGYASSLSIMFQIIAGIFSIFVIIFGMWRIHKRILNKNV